MTPVPQRSSTQRKFAISVFDVVSIISIAAIVSATMVFALGGVTSRSVLALCQQQGSATATAILRYDANNPNTPLTNANFVAELTTSLSNGGPYLDSWPSNYPHYAFTVMDGTLWVFTGNSLTTTSPPVATALASYNLAPGDLRSVNVMSATPDWINYDKYGPDACAGVQ